MVKAGDVERAVALHAVKADQRVLNRNSERVSNMQKTRHIRWRQWNHKRLGGVARLIVTRSEKATLLPPCVP